MGEKLCEREVQEFRRRNLPGKLTLRVNALSASTLLGARFFNIATCSHLLFLELARTLLSPLFEPLHCKHPGVTHLRLLSPPSAV